MSEREIRDDWYESLTQEEKDSLNVKICIECCHAFDDNPTRNVCKTCEEWVCDELGFTYI